MSTRREPSASLSPADVVLHPVRMRIVQAFLGDRSLTTGDLRDELPDVPGATLYRQVAALAGGGVLDVVAERRVRGAVERTYRLRAGAASVDAGGTRRMSVEEHRRAFLTFAVGLLGDFERYLQDGTPDVPRDGVGYRRTAVHLSDEEVSALVEDLRAVLEPRLRLPPSPARRRRLIATVLMPDAGRVRPARTSPGAP